MKRNLTIEDMIPVPSSQKADKLTNSLNNEWKKEFSKSKSRRSLFNASFKFLKYELALNALFQFLNSLFATCQPLLVGWILKDFSNNEEGYLINVIIYATCLIFCGFFSVIFRNLQFWYGFLCGLRLRIASSGLLFNKLLTLNQKSIAQTTTGQIFNLLSTDVRRFEMSFVFINYCWMGVIHCLALLAIMYKIAGFPALAGVFVMLVLNILQALSGHIISVIKLKMSVNTDTRVKLISNVITGIKAIKVYAWEDKFLKDINISRKSETQRMMYCRYLQSFHNSQLMYQKNLGYFAFFVSIIFIIRDYQPEMLCSSIVYTIVGLMSTLFSSMTLFLPPSIQGLADIMVTCKRLENFLELDTLACETDAQTIDEIEPFLKFSDVTAYWDQVTGLIFIKFYKKKNRSAVLIDIHLNINSTPLIGVIGPVGAGKSSLVLAALGELPIASGYILRSNRVGYQPQVSWIYPGTIRDNVICEKTFDYKRYREVLRVTTLDIDCFRMPFKDKTFVGERGVSLSGGQKARICLARIAYSNSQLVFLDDPLAAVDARVSGILFRECIKKFMGNRMRVLVTHQHHLLEEMDYIIVMYEGKIMHSGSYKELLNKGLNLEEICQNKNTSTEIDDATVEVSINQSNEHFQLEDFIEEIEHDETEQSIDESLANYVDKQERMSPLTRPKKGFILQSKIHVASEEPFVRSNSTIITRSQSIHKTSFDDGKVDESHEFDKEGTSEKITTGLVSLRTYWNYWTSGNGVCVLIFGFLFFVSMNVFHLILELWMAKWIFHNDIINSNKTSPSELSNFPDNKVSCYIYVGILLIVILTGTLRYIFFFKYTVKSSIALHNKMIQAIIYTRMYFFETNSSGRILNRLSKDISMVDDFLPMTYLDSIQCSLLVLEILIIGAVSSYYVIFPIIPLLFAFMYVRRCYLRVSRDLKRFEAVTLSPVFTHITSTLQGLPCIRADRSEDSRNQEICRLVDNHTRIAFLSLASARWTSMQLDLLVVIYSGVVIIIGIVLRVYTSFDSSQLGLMVTMATALPGLCQWAVKQSAETENLMISAERCLEYTKLASEEDTRKPVRTEDEDENNDYEEVQVRIPHNDVIGVSNNYEIVSEFWPENGLIVFENVSLRYNKDSGWALKDININVPAKHKIGIVGRTGAGKSSLLSALFRLVELEKGRILIDNVDIHKLNLNVLRKKVSVIPQDPIMFVGTIRENLDPQGMYSDEKLLRALHVVQLDQLLATMSEGLDSQISEEGSNLSAGQRQLISLARAILRENKVLVVDEATANVDPSTDMIIQQTIRREFQNCSVLTIAHRLHTIMDSDLVIVMETGQVAEVGEPHELLNPKNPSVIDPSNPITGKGKFAALVQETGIEESKVLSNIARTAYNSTINTKNRKTRLLSKY